MLSKKLLNELEVILKEEYNLHLQAEIVAEIGDSLVGYFDLLTVIKNTNEHENKNSGSPNN